MLLLAEELLVAVVVILMLDSLDVVVLDSAEVRPD